MRLISCSCDIRFSATKPAIAPSWRKRSFFLSSFLYFFLSHIYLFIYPHYANFVSSSLFSNFNVPVSSIIYCKSALGQKIATTGKSGQKTWQNGWYRQTRQRSLTDIHNSTNSVTSGAFACSVLVGRVNWSLCRQNVCTSFSLPSISNPQAKTRGQIASAKNAYQECAYQSSIILGRHRGKD